MTVHHNICPPYPRYLILQGESDDEAAALNRWISTNSKDRPKAGKEGQAASDSAAAASRNTSQHNLATSSHSSLTGACCLCHLYMLLRTHMLFSVSLSTFGFSFNTSLRP